MNNSSNTSITSLVPGGVVTTQNISTVIKPKENNRSMQFVKIQTPELSKTAEEQIRVAQESKITKDKIKEVEEEWQSNLLNWKSKRRQQFVGTHSNDHQDEQNNNDPNENGRKIKTFAEMIEERTKTGNRLNFHLERYIGSSESDQDNSDHVDHVSKEISQLSLNSNKNSNHIAYRSQQDNCTQDSISLILKENEITNNGNNGALMHGIHDGQQECAADDEEEDFFDDMVPINSTFKQGVEHPPTPPTIHSDDKIKLSLDVDTRTKEVSSAANYEDNASDHDDEDDEQEEEQKQLQRIAFVAKLKAFERLTKPSLQEPKFVAPKPTRTSPPAPLAPARPSQDTCVLTPPTRQRQQPPQQLQSQTRAELPREADLPTKTITEMNTLVQQEPRLVPQKPQASPESRRPEQTQVQTKLMACRQLSQEEQPKTKSPPTQTQTQSIQSVRRQAPSIPIDSQIDPIAPIAPPTKQIHPVAPHISSVDTSPRTPNRPTHDVKQPSPVSAPLPDRHQVSKQHNQQQQPPPRQQSQPPLKDDKNQDRTVLSVSGKKRCSSCQEELGRGAAAFVIESLNLVYHTNCFRCSVCHVNLSNGFRGVDVRVHAGALHCQNCYSKDGLNYSRV